jgi:hypothetical protein
VAGIRCNFFKASRSSYLLLIQNLPKPHTGLTCGRTLQRLHPGTYGMDRDTLKRRLTTAEEQVAIAAQNVARQRELVAELERDSQDASQAKKMLEQFLDQHALHIADRDSLIKELSELPPSP